MKLLNKIINNKKGLTLMEILVVLSIIVIIMSLYSIRYRSANKRTELIMTTRTVVGNLRLAQTYAASAKRFGGDISSNTWGVYFDKTNEEQYIIFSDVDGNGKYTDSTEDFKVIKLPSKVVVSELFGKSDSTSIALGDNLSVLFTPPDPETTFSYPSTEYSGSEIGIILRDSVNGSTKVIEINSFGLIDITK